VKWILQYHSEKVCWSVDISCSEFVFIIAKFPFLSENSQVINIWVLELLKVIATAVAGQVSVYTTTNTLS